MLYKPQYDENGKKILCEMNGVNADMLMDIYVQKIKKGDSLVIEEEKNECTVPLSLAEFLVKAIIGIIENRLPSSFVISHLNENLAILICRYDSSCTV